MLGYTIVSSDRDSFATGSDKNNISAFVFQSLPCLSFRHQYFDPGADGHSVITTLEFDFFDTILALA